jgi:hypothetical protein
MQVRNGPTRRVVVTVAALVSVALPSILWLTSPALFVFDSDNGSAANATATVIKAVACGQGADAETVTFRHDGRELQARFDGCGHQEGETLTIAVPDETAGDEVVVRAASATPGGENPRRRLSLPLLVLSTVAGIGYVHLVARGPRKRRGSPPPMVDLRAIPGPPRVRPDRTTQP